MTKHVGDNKKIITLMLASAAVLVMYLPELFDLLRPLFSGIADGGLSYFFVFILKLAVYIAGFAAIAVSAKKYAGLSLFGRKADKLSPKYAVLIFVLTPSLRRSARAPRSSRRRTRFPSNIFLFCAARCYPLWRRRFSRNFSKGCFRIKNFLTCRSAA